MSIICSGGPEIPFRGGRIDAKQPGPAGVPEPEQDLATHTASFARQGFSPVEMIELIACGHTIGYAAFTNTKRYPTIEFSFRRGVQQKFFPQIVPQSEVDPNTNPPGNTHFDTTFDHFDNTM
jgi:hypothetical protein